MFKAILLSALVVAFLYRTKVKQIVLDVAGFIRDRL